MRRFQIVLSASVLLVSGCIPRSATFYNDAALDNETTSADVTNDGSDRYLEASPDVQTDTADATDTVDAPQLDLSPPRPVAPLSTALVTSFRPTLHWVLAPGTTGARVQLCHDRNCTNEIMHFDANGSSSAPSTDLPTGVAFWRLFGQSGTQTGTNWSATWEFFVGGHTAPRDASWGSRLDVNGDGYVDVLVGAPSADRAYVYLGSSSGLATVAATTLMGTANSRFGSAVASAGDVNGDGFGDAIVGADGGPVYLYLGSATGLVSMASTQITGPGNLQFGSALDGASDLNGDGYADVVIGASGPSGVTGGAYVYLGSSTPPPSAPASALTTPTGATSGFGQSVAGVGDLHANGVASVLVTDGNGLGGSGVYLYSGGASITSANPTTLSVPSGAIAASASAGDINGDGYADIVLASYTANGFAGTAYVFLGSQSGPGSTSTPDTTLSGPASSLFGWAVANAGDVNNDGYGDLIIGAPNVGNMGAAYVYLGSSGGLMPTFSTTLSGPGANALFGRSAAVAGVEADGFGDVVVGAPGIGNAYIYHGNSSGTATTAVTTLMETIASSAFGTSVF